MNLKPNILVLVAVLALLLTPKIKGQTTSPPYLSQFPSLERIKADVKGVDAMETAAKQAGIFWQLRQLIYSLALSQRRTDRQFSPDEQRLEVEYRNAHYKAIEPFEGKVTGADKPKWFELRGKYEMDLWLRDEVFKKYFTPDLRRAVYVALKGEVPTTNAPEGSRLTPSAASLTAAAARPTTSTASSTTGPSTQPGTYASNNWPATSAVGINITAADMPLIIEGLGIPQEARTRLSANSEERKDLARDIRRLLAAAEEAKAAGYLARPELKLQTELMHAFVISQAYFKQRQDAGATNPEQLITTTEIDSFFNEPATGPQFEMFLQDYSKNSELRGAPVPAEKRKELREHYGRVMVGMRQGITTAHLDRDRKTQLTVMLQQAKLLAGAYAQEIKARFRPTPAEIDTYIAAHSEYDAKAERARINAILARVRAGEDFAKLAAEFTEDPSGKGKGGDLGWFGRGTMVKSFEDAVFALKPGQVSDVVETVLGFHIIKLDERRSQSAGEEVHARHILIQFKSNARQPGSAMSPRDKASAALEEEKRNLAFDEAAGRRHIQVAEEYAVQPLR